MLKYPPVVKHGNEKSTVNGNFILKIIFKWEKHIVMFDYQRVLCIHGHLGWLSIRDIGYLFRLANHVWLSGCICISLYDSICRFMCSVNAVSVYIIYIHTCINMYLYIFHAFISYIYRNNIYIRVLSTIYDSYMTRTCVEVTWNRSNRQDSKFCGKYQEGMKKDDQLCRTLSWICWR